MKGWICLRLEGAAYPLLRSEPASTAIFHLYHDCSEVSWRRLVEYEGSEYTWIELQIEGLAYRVFMSEPSLPASSEIWDLETFQRRDKSHYLKDIFG